MSPAYFGLVETEPGRFAATWKVSVSGGLADTLTPVLPENCAIAGPPRQYLLDGVQMPREFRLQAGTVVCSEPLAGRQFSVTGLAGTDTDVLLRVDYLDGTSFSHRLVPAAPVVTIPADPGVAAVAGTYTVLGIEHILIGLDHLLFVLALLLIVRGTGRLVATITAFTLAHSITLAASVLEVVRLPSAAVEATIALSILFLATELVRRKDPLPSGAPSLASRYPWIVAFTFGLLHGFGFAGVLLEIGLPGNAVPLALLFFNVGVELGQLLFIGAVLLSGWLLRSLIGQLPATAPRFASYVIGSVAAYWVIERTLTTIW